MNQKKETPADKGGETQEAESVEEFTEEDAEAAFAEGLGETAPETSDGITDKETAPEDSETTVDTDQPGAAGTETPGDETKVDDGPSKKPSYEDLEKQLQDTKGWAHGLSATVAELTKKVESAEPPGTKPGETDKDDDDMPEEIKSYLEDYPEAKKAFEFLLKKQMGGMSVDEIKNTVASMQSHLDQASFEKAVVTGFMAEDGTWINGHPDAYKSMATPAYKEWFTAELKRDPTIGNISDPKAAIDVLTRHKTHCAKSAAATHDAGLQGGEMAQDVKDIASGAVETGAGTGPEVKPKTDEDRSPEEIFDEHSS